MTRHHGVLSYVAAAMLQKLKDGNLVHAPDCYEETWTLFDCYQILGWPEGDDLYAEDLA